MPDEACQAGSPRHLTEVSEEGPRAIPQAHLLDILLHAAVRGMHDSPHHFHVATDNQGFIRCVCVYSYSPMTDDRFWNVSSLPQCVAVIFKLPRVRGLERHRGTLQLKFRWQKELIMRPQSKGKTDCYLSPSSETPILGRTR